MQIGPVTSPWPCLHICCLRPWDKMLVYSAVLPGRRSGSGRCSILRPARQRIRTSRGGTCRHANLVMRNGAYTRCALPYLVCTHVYIRSYPIIYMLTGACSAFGQAEILRDVRPEFITRCLEAWQCASAEAFQNRARPSHVAKTDHPTERAAHHHIHVSPRSPCAVGVPRTPKLSTL